VQGVTEFLPISSDGHLVLLGHWIQTPGDGIALVIFLHAGSLAALLWAFRRDLLGIFRRPEAGQMGGPRLLGLLILATVPVVIIGLSGCVTHVRDGPVYQGSSASYTPAEQRLRQQSRSFAETSGQACLSVGAAAAIAAYLLSDRGNRGRNAAIAGAAGCGVGMGVNYYVQNRRAQYANAEHRLQVMIRDIRRDNARLAQLVGTTRQVVAEDRRRIAQVDDPLSVR